MTDFKLSSDEFRKNLFQTFRNRGVLEALKSQLRNRLITELQQTADGVGALTEGTPVLTENLCQLAANSLVAEHLKRCKYDYSLSVFLPESGLRKDKLLAVRDILHLLKIGPDSQLFKKLERLSSEEKSFKGLLLELMCHLLSSTGHEKTSKAVQVSSQHESSVEDKLQYVEKQYIANLQKENLNWSHQAEKRLLKLQKQWEEKKKAQLEEELQHLKLTEVARVRLEEKENHQKEIQQIRKQLERDFAVKAEKLKASEKEMAQVLQNQKQQHEEQAHSQRQKLLQDMLALKEREADFDLKYQMDTKSLQLEEERIKTLTEELKLKRSLLEDAEASYQNRLDGEIQRHKLKCEEEFRDRRRELELKDKRFQQEKENFDETKLMYMSCSDELQATKEKLNQLQIQLQNNKTSLASALQEKEITTKRFNENYEEVKKREVILSKENAAIQRKLLESEEKQQENQRIINEFTKKSAESSTELHRLRDEIKRIKAEQKSKEKSWKEYKFKMESRVQEECEQNRKQQQMYQELAASRRELDQELADLKVTLQHTQQVLDMELGRNLASDLPCVESVLGNATSSIQENVSPPERVDHTMDETSSTAEMIAQSKALFTRLEREAKELEESYQKFQSRIKHMELDLHPTLASTSLDFQLPNQSLLAQSGFD